jgi:acetyl esterase
MPLDPKVKALLTAIAAAGEPDITGLSADYARAQVERGYARMNIPVEPVGIVQNLTIPAPACHIPVRIYTPEGSGPFPVIVFFHGGGWVFFGLDAYDSICTRLCNDACSIVVSVDYRRSPENKFPAATDDCLTASRYVYENACEWNGNPDVLFLAGDSAGGNLAAVTAIRILQEGGPPIRGQVLIYPVTDYYIPAKPSFSEFAEGYGLTKEAMAWFWEKYLSDSHDAANPYVAPLLADSLAGVPPAIVVIAGFDLLRDEGLAYVKKLENSGVPVTLLFYEEMIHGFLSYLGILKQAQKAIGEIALWIRQQC